MTVTVNVPEQTAQSAVAQENNPTPPLAKIEQVKGAFIAALDNTGTPDGIITTEEAKKAFYQLHKF